MNDILILVLQFVLGYGVAFCSVLFLGKLFFPIFTKEEIEKRQAAMSLKH